MLDFLIWGPKTISLFDVWSIEHFLTGVSVGALVDFFHTKRTQHNTTQEHRYLCIIFVLFLAYFWETIEYYLEDGATGIERVTYWFQGVEFFGNRIITDPLMVLSGHLFATRYPIIIWPARFLSFAWLLVHVFVFPHCMYLHEIFF